MTEYFQNQYYPLPKDPMDESWKRIDGFPDYYISDYGRIWSLHKKDGFKAPMWNGNGYWRIELWDKRKKTRFLIHRLVAQYFLADFDPKKDVDHLNNIRTDNRAVNLECVSRSENVLRAHARAREKLTPEEELVYALESTQWWDDDDE